ncbi:Methyl-accepting chemotaxis protein PctC [Andreprevotia sp. IGB-42]|uniref:methyl-accepting chemotaxis protein n=1 Tax=Andreprevotia sp. IGB-42 TaxID=2497473 RepID=UPI00157E9DB4|nr:methyl-accepting chemotaxis protein [Andreprevotia sp. IGB-42]KAF0813009.1 Methyl-accepting chemotaxis protein PctC [Andreprevotia sp. IGB-42]
MKISTRLYLLCGLGVGAVIIMALISGMLLAQIRSNSTEMLDNAVPSTQTIGETKQLFMQSRMAVYQHLLQSDMVEKDKTEATLNANHTEISKLLDAYERKYADDATDKANIKKAKDEVEKYFALVPEIIKFSKDGNYGDAQTAIAGKVSPQADQTIAALKATADYNLQFLADSRKDVFSAITTGQTVGIVGSLIAAVAVFVVGTLLVRSVTGPLGQLRDAVVRLASDYDFTRRLPARGNDEVSQTLHAFNQLLDTMQASFRQLQQVGSGLGQSAHELADASAQMSSASRNVSESTSSMAAAVEEMTVSVSHVAERAGGADDLAREAGKLAGSGGAVIESTIAKINGIAQTVQTAATQIESLKERTANINAVVSVIKEIADQTNLLALNAAIEAARAGETGRGFAVVADEVRKLAERTALSTQEIAGTVGSIQSEASQTVTSMQAAVAQVGAGVTQAQEASSAIRQIRAGSDDVVKQVSEISGAMREQSAASTSIAQQIERVAHMSEESNATAVRTADSAERLRQISRQLQEAISRYKV